LVKKVRNYFDVSYATTASSGTASIHCAVGALELKPGSEVITSPITDMGTVIGVLYQTLIPVFADVDPHSYNITAETIKERITENTRAIIVVHLAGNPAEMDEILELADKHNLIVIEDCAQSYGGVYKGKKVGTMGNIGCYSLNAYKHISAGDGGFCITNDKELYEKMHNFADKYYDRHGKGVRLSQLAPNYRITELQSAVALAQFKKLPQIVKQRKILGNAFNKGLEELDIPVLPHKVGKENECSYWFTMVRIRDKFPSTRNQYANALKYEKVSASAGYISKPLYMESVFAKKNFFPGEIWPAEVVAGREYEYKEGDCPVAEKVLKTAIRIPINEAMSDNDVQKMIQGFKRAYEGLNKES